MDAPTSLTGTDLDGLFSEGDLRGMQIIAGALAMGIVMFAGIAVTLPAGEATASGEQGANVLKAMGAVNALLAVSCIVASLVVPKLLLSAVLTRPAAEPLAALRNAVRTGVILRLALLEGPALFALVAVLMGRMNPATRDSTLTWLNAVTLVPLGALFAAGFPRKESLRRMVEDRLATARLDSMHG